LAAVPPVTGGAAPPGSVTKVIESKIAETAMPTTVLPTTVMPSARATRSGSFERATSAQDTE
jgi:hypothetical protein